MANDLRARRALRDSIDMPGTRAKVGSRRRPEGRDMTESIFAVEPEIRLGFFLGVFAIMACWEAVMPRRGRAVSRWIRWPNNLGIVALNTILLRFLYPTAAVGLALLGEERAWGLLNNLALPYWLSVALAVLLLDFAIYLQHVMCCPWD
jgi:sterol desaturase/sphingolipid hydroxylase (fatty acid hydroxylase superfamily)